MQTGLIHFGVVKVGMVVIDFVMAYSSLLREKKRCDFVTDVISRIFTFLR